MKYEDYIFKIDHYDAYNYIMIGPLSLIAALSFVALNVFFEKARRFPGNLLIIISLSEIVLCIHWISSGINSPFIYGTKEIDPNGSFCTINKHAAFIAGSV